MSNLFAKLFSLHINTHQRRVYGTIGFILKYAF